MSSPDRLHQKVAALLLAYATVLVWRCPCAKILSCHLSPFILSVAGALTVIAMDYK